MGGYDTEFIDLFIKCAITGEQLHLRARKSWNLTQLRHLALNRLRISTYSKSFLTLKGKSLEENLKLDDVAAIRPYVTLNLYDSHLVGGSSQTM